MLGLALTGCKDPDPMQAIAQQHASGDFAGSIEPLRRLLAENPDDPEANYRYGHALAATHRAHLASFSLRKAMEDPEWLIPAGAQLAYTALATRDFNVVIEVAGRVLEQDPDNVQFLLMRASAHAHWMKDAEAALADADRVLEIDPDAVEAYEPRILALLALGRDEEASGVLAEAGRRVAERGANDKVLAWHCSTTATFEQDDGDLEAARATWLRCLEAYPSDLEVVKSAVGFYDSLGELDQSLNVMRAALADAPTSRELRVTLAQRLSLTGSTSEAEAMLREATEVEDPQLAAAAWMDLGKLRMRLEEHGAAADAFQRALELAREAGSPNSQLLFEYADSLILAGRFVLALEVSEELELPAHRHLIRARVAQERRDPVRALEEFDEALRLWPDNPYARYYAARAAEEVGDFDRALAEFRYAIRIDPSATDARTRGAALLLARRRLVPALQMLHSAEGQAPLDIEGELLSLYLLGQMGDMVAVAAALTEINQRYPSWAGRALSQAAEGLERRAGPTAAMIMLSTAPGADFEDPRFAPALRTLVRLSHEAAESDETAAIPIQQQVRKVLASHPEFAAFLDIRGLDLELSGAPEDEVRASYERALELAPADPYALAGLGRLALRHDPEAALAYFDQAAAADATDPDWALEAARALIAAGRLSNAGERLDALLVEHPFEVEAARERARLDVEQGVATAQTLERARRAVLLGGGPESLELLSQVHSLRDEPEPAARAARRARLIREARAAKEFSAEMENSSLPQTGDLPPLDGT